jgi:hypothetical protein
MWGVGKLGSPMLGRGARASQWPSSRGMLATAETPGEAVFGGPPGIPPRPADAPTARYAGLRRE